MRKAIFLLLSILSFYAKAQVNILQPQHFEQTIPNSFLEIGNHYFFLTYKESSAYGSPHPNEFTLFKLDKYSLAITDSTVAMGDVKQNDSVIFSYPVLVKKSPTDGIYIFYQKTFLPDSSSTPINPYDRIICCSAFDTMLAPLFPEKKIWSEYQHQPLKNSGLYTGSFIGNRVFLGISAEDTSYAYQIIRYVKLDANANLLADDTLGDKSAAATQQLNRALMRIIPYKDQILVSAQNLSYFAGAALEAGLYLADTNMHFTDSFFRTQYTVYPDDTVTVFSPTSNMIALPSGGLIEGYSNADPTQKTRGILFKSEAATDFEPTKSLHLYAKDSNDHYHATTFTTYDVITYNTADQLIYFAELTHTDHYFSGNCSGNYNFLEITCADTNLNKKWTRYIFSDSGVCIAPGHVTPSDNRPGAIIAGTRFYSNNSLKSFAYRLDSTTATGIINTEGLTIRDRFRIYPNPATDIIYADDIFDKLKKLTIYDMQGRVVINHTLHAGKNSISIGQLPSGIYLVNLQTEDGEEHREKFVVR